MKPNIAYHLLDANNQGYFYTIKADAEAAADLSYNIIHEVQMNYLGNDKNSYLVNIVHSWERKNNVWVQTC